jgi:hypothetical protein
LRGIYTEDALAKLRLCPVGADDNIANGMSAVDKVDAHTPGVWRARVVDNVGG